MGGETLTHPLRDVPLAGGPVEIRGALDLEAGEAGLLPRRLPAWTRAQYPDAFMDEVAAMPSGVRLAFRTGARTLELEVLTSVWHPPATPVPDSAGVADLLVDGELAGRAEVPVGHLLHVAGPRDRPRIERGAPGTLRFAGLPEGVKDVELWLPQGTRTELVALRADAPVEPPRSGGRRRWVHHGSSISQCVEADSPTGTWPVVAARRAGVEVVNLGLAGNAMLDPYVARTMRDLPADLLSVKIGINIVGSVGLRQRTFGPAVHGFLDTLRDGHPDTPLLVVSPISCPALEDTPGPTATTPERGFHGLGTAADVAAGALTLRAVRAELARIVAERAAHDPHLHHLDGRELLGPREVADLPDGLHPNAAAYRRMGERFATLAFGPKGPFAP